MVDRIKKKRLLTKWESVVSVNVTKLLDENGLTQKEASKKFGIKYTSFCQLLDGTMAWRVEHLGKISAFFNLQPSDLMIKDFKEQKKYNDDLRECIDLMEIPSIKRIVIGKIEELKLQLKNEIDAHKKIKKNESCSGTAINTLEVKAG